jgi:hypothetical protein
MNPFFAEVLKSGEITPSDPATRKPLHGADRGVGIRLEPGTKNACSKCKWSTPEGNDLTKGQCMIMKNKMGAIWVRHISDYYNMTCEKFEEGEVDFRDLT